MSRTPLYDIERDHGARFTDVGGVETPSDFGDCLAEYHAAVGGVGLFDRSERGRLLLTGADRVQWLQGMVSRDVRPLEAGAPAVCGCVLNATGHLLADVRIVRSESGDSLLLDMARQNVEKVRRIFEGFIITEDVEVSDATDALARLSVQGPGATEAWTQEHAAGAEGVTVAPADHTGLGGFDLYCAAAEAPALWQRLVDAGAAPCGWDALETLRIEAGIPRYGVDMDESTIPLECGLEPTHISHDKGCYVGQEIIARIHARGHTNRALTGLILEGAALPHHGHKVYPTGGDTAKDVGWVTSSTHSPYLGRSVALAYLRHEAGEPGTSLRIAQEDATIRATAAALPFRPAP